MSRHFRMFACKNSTTTPATEIQPELKNIIVMLTAFLCTLICIVGLVIAVVRCIAAANKKKKILKALPKVTYSTETIAPTVSGCVICLTEFTAGDEIRVLPQCGHGFHVTCIDTWIGFHYSCPSCRQILVPAPRCKKCGELPAAESTGSQITAAGETSTSVDRFLNMRIHAKLQHVLKVPTLSDNCINPSSINRSLWTRNQMHITFSLSVSSEQIAAANMESIGAEEVKLLRQNSEDQNVKQDQVEVVSVDKDNGKDQSFYLSQNKTDEMADHEAYQNGLSCSKLSVLADAVLCCESADKSPEKNSYEEPNMSNVKRQKTDRAAKRKAALATWKWDEVEIISSDDEDGVPSGESDEEDVMNNEVGVGNMPTVVIHSLNRVEPVRMF